MKTRFFMIMKIFTLSFALIFPLYSSPDFDQSIFDKIKISQEDLPNGFVFGKIPNFAKSTIQSNPWNMDRNAINKMTKNIYPDAEPSAVKGIYISIIAKESSPYNDDLVCFMILYKDASAAKKENQKLEDFTKFNRDRVLTINKDNLSVILLSDETENFRYILEFSKKIEEKLEL